MNNEELNIEQIEQLLEKKKKENENINERDVVEENIEELNNKKSNNSSKDDINNTNKTNVSFQLEIHNTIKYLLSELNLRMIEREELNMLLVLAIFSKSHIFLIGKPGVGKTFSIHLIKDVIKDSKYFETLIMADTKKEEIFGTTYIDNNGRLQYDTSNSVVDSNFVFLDEVFKGSSEILNGLLSITSNDRNFFMRPFGEVKVPLNTFFAASNEFPSDEALDPFDDRLPIRYEVLRIKDDNNFKKLISKEFKTEPINIQIPLEHIDRVVEEAKEIKINDNMLNILTSLKNAIIRDGIDISDRKFFTAVNILRISAYLNNRKELNYSDLFLLLHIGWRNFTDRRKLREVIFKYFFSTKDNFNSQLKKIEENLKVYETELNKIVNFINKKIIFQNATPEENEQEFLNYRNYTGSVLKLLSTIYNEQILPLLNLIDFINTIENEIENNIFLINFKNKTLQKNNIDILFSYKNSLEENYNFIMSFLEHNKTLSDYQS